MSQSSQLHTAFKTLPFVLQRIQQYETPTFLFRFGKSKRLKKLPYSPFSMSFIASSVSWSNVDFVSDDIFSFLLFEFPFNLLKACKTYHVKQITKLLLYCPPIEEYKMKRVKASSKIVAKIPVKIKM